jgi:tRNA (guanine10-N2)-dimethyltransferase
MLIAILGRQPEISIAELESFFGSEAVDLINNSSALINTEEADIERFGGVLKFAKIDLKIKPKSFTDIENQIINFYTKNLPLDIGKLTFGLSWYESNLSAANVNKISLKLKSALKRKTSVRLVSNTAPVLSTATSHHNKLGLSDKKIEIIVTQDRTGIVYVGKSIGTQNISAYAARDQKRPKRDARVGMLPPKLAQIIINLAIAGNKSDIRLLDPFCGTGVILQEAVLLGIKIYGSDLEPRMVDYTRENLIWIDDKLSKTPLEVGDATNHIWSEKIDCVATETFLGRPFSQEPSQNQLTEEKRITKNIITGFLKNIKPQIDQKTRLCLAIPAWKRPDGTYQKLSIDYEDIGYEVIKFKNVNSNNLIYHREDQIVARQLIVLKLI